MPRKSKKKKSKQRPNSGGLAVARGAAAVGNARPAAVDNIANPKTQEKRAAALQNENESSGPNLTYLGVDVLPKKALSTIASFLYKIDRALFATALSAPSSSWEECGWERTPSRASRIVMSGPYYRPGHGGRPYDEKWEDLGFRQWYLNRNHRLWDNLTDGDLCGMLVCTAAIHNLKVLEIPYCLRIVGHGLAPLFGSVVLERVDLSCVLSDFHVSNELPPPMMCDRAVIPILRSIVGAGAGSALKYLQLPKMWRCNPSDLIRFFIDEYNQFLDDQRTLVCGNCDELCHSTENRPWVEVDGASFGLQNMTCHRCARTFCHQCERSDLGHCSSCEKQLCHQCACVLTCRVCSDSFCDGCKDMATCDACHEHTCCDEGCSQKDPAFDCPWCDRWLCEKCVPKIECGAPGCMASSCKDCSVKREDSVQQCTHCGKGFCSDCQAMEQCFLQQGSICPECHRSIHGDFECYWQPLPAKLKGLVAGYSLKEFSRETAAEFWRDCIELLWSDKDYNWRVYGDVMQQKESLLVLVAHHLTEGRDLEAKYLFFFGMLLSDVMQRGPNEVKRILGVRVDPNERAEILEAYFDGFHIALYNTGTREQMIARVRIEIKATRLAGWGNLISALLDKVQLPDTPIHHSLTESTNEYRVGLYRAFGNSVNMNIIISNEDQKWKGNDRYVYKDTSFEWLLRDIAAEHDYYGSIRLASPNASPSTHYFRARWRRNGQDPSSITTLFVSSSGRKTLWDLGVRDGDEIIVGGVAPTDEGGRNPNAEAKVGSKKSKRSRKKRGAKKKQKKRAKPQSPPSLTEAQLREKCRQEHSRAMTPVFEELDPLLRDIRNHLNDLTLKKSAPKVRRPNRGKNKCPTASVAPTPPPVDTHGGKAGKVAYHVLVGEVTNLYKTSKYKPMAPVTIDLHGCSRDEALQKLNESLPVWVDTAMKGEHPWVIPVDIVCGGGSQILSDLVKKWIRTKRQVANRPKGYA